MHGLEQDLFNLPVECHLSFGKVTRKTLIKTL